MLSSSSQPSHFSLLNLLLYSFFILLCITLPWSLAAMQITLVITSLLTIFILITEKRRLPLCHPFFLILGVYAGLRVLSAVLSPEPSLSFNALYHTDWVILPVVFLAAAPLSEKQKLNALNGLLISAGVVGIYGIYQFAVGLDVFGHHLTPYNGWYRAVGGYNFYLTFAGNQLMALGMAITFLLLPEKNGTLNRLYGFISVIIFVSILGTFARSAWLGFLVMVPLGILLTKPRWLIYVIPGIIIGGILAVLLIPALQTRFLSIFDVTQNETRITIWKTTWEMIKAHPVWGVGPGLYKQNFLIYKVPGYYDTYAHAHNDYLNMAANSGLMGLTSWLAVWSAWFYYSFQTLRLKTISLMEQRILLGSILGLTGIFIAAFFQCYYTDLENNIFWWFLVVLNLQIIIRHSGKTTSVVEG